jgi:hypothetical protein
MDHALQAGAVNAAAADLRFPHHWQAEILSHRPAILPARHFVYPREVEEVERGALEVLVKPLVPNETVRGVPQVSSLRPGIATTFLATCALGFRDPAVPTGIWSTPNPWDLCAVSGGYAYVIDTAEPERFTMIEYRPVLEVRALVEDGLLLFVGHRSLLAWGAEGQAWETVKLSDEGVTITRIENGVLHGTGWEMMSDKEKPFAVNLRSGLDVE